MNFSLTLQSWKDYKRIRELCWTLVIHTVLNRLWKMEGALTHFSLITDFVNRLHKQEREKLWCESSIFVFDEVESDVTTVNWL